MNIVDFSRFFVPKMVPSWAKLASIWHRDGPSGWQDGHKYAQVDPNMGEVGTKTN